MYSIETLNSKSDYNTVKYFDIYDDKGHLEKDCFLSKEDAWKECDRRNMEEKQSWSNFGQSDQTNLV